MNTLATWNAFRELDDFSNRLSTLFGKTAQRDGERSPFSSNVWAPLVDISEDDKEYLIKAELPGIDKRDVRVSIEKGVLTISGERHQEHDEKKGKLHRIERSYGSFQRSFSVPDDADSSKVAAEYKNGVLHLHLPKTPEKQPKQIEIKVA